MSKKNTGLLIALGAVMGAAAAGISYYLKYKAFNDELEQDFHDYEDDEEDRAKEAAAERNYIPLDYGKASAENASATEESEANEDDDPEIEVVFEEIPLEELKKYEGSSEETVSTESVSEGASKKEPAPAAVTVEEDTDGAGA